MMFKVFVAFCILMEVSVPHPSVEILLAFLECLVVNNVSAARLTKVAIKAQLVLCDLPYSICNTVIIKY